MEHIYQNIEGWFDFESFYSDMVKALPNNSHIVEIGSWKGKSTSYLAVEIINSGKNVRFDCVDTWEGSTEHKLSSIDSKENLYITFLKNTEPLRDIINHIRTTSVLASTLYKDESLDFVFIDASHDYEDVKKDIQSWYPKIKRGGIIAGHDYSPAWAGVVNAVDEFFVKGKEINFFTTGSCWVHKKP